MGKRSWTTEGALKKLNEIHGGKYVYPDFVAVPVKSRIRVLCEDHGEFSPTLNDHLSGRGCRKCGWERNAAAKRWDKNKFTTESKKIHGDKYDYSEVTYVNARTKVKIACPTHGKFKQAPYRHLDGSGCPKCSYAEFGKKTCMGLEEFLRRAAERHGDQYDYSLVKDYGVESDEISVVCKDHGEFTTTFKIALNSGGCQQCITLGRKGINSKPVEHFLQKSHEAHGDKYTYDNVMYEGVGKKVLITCPEHGDFLKSPQKHMAGQGCPECMMDWRREYHWHSPIYFSETERSQIYVMEFSPKDGEKFLKIGLSSDPIRRLKDVKQSSGIKNVCYYSILKGIGNDIRQLEALILRELRGFKYIYKERFQGFTECLEYKALKKVLSKIETSKFELEDVTHEYA